MDKCETGGVGALNAGNRSRDGSDLMLLCNNVCCCIRNGNCELLVGCFCTGQLVAVQWSVAGINEESMHRNPWPYFRCHL